MNRVIIDMENPNTLVALAYIKINKNPLHVFCNYILYILSIAPNQSLRADEVKQRLREKFGLNMPQLMMQNCVRILQKSGDITCLPHGGGYAIDHTDFDAESFENTFRRLQEQEEVVIKSIVSYVNDRYKLSWSEEDAKKYLSAFLAEEGNGARLFLYNEIKTDGRYVSPSWYIAKYVNDVQNKADSLEKKYLEEIVNGMMIYQGIYQIGDYQQNKDQKYKGTVFYLDTKLVLRALGYSWSAQVEATRELIDLIVKKYGGKIGVFRQTLNEVANALDRAGRSYERREKASDISDYELRLYAELNPTGATLLRAVSMGVLQCLRNNYDVVVTESFDWDAPEIRRHSIETAEIVKYISSKKEWLLGALTSDVEIINQINILRKGDYSVCYGGKSKLPVFLTSNVGLVYAFREYVSEISAVDTSVKWNVHALPIITDNMLLFRLWVPYANEYTSLPALTLSRYVHSAQNLDTRFFEKLKEVAIAYRKEEKINIFDITEMERQRLIEILVASSKGDEELLSEELVALGVKEFAKMENIALHTQIEDLQNTVGNLSSRMVELAAKPYVNKLGIRRALILAAKWWWLIMAILFAIAEMIIGKCADAALSGWRAAVPIAAVILIKVIDSFCNEKAVQNLVLKKAVGLTWQKYTEKINKNISEGDMIYIDRIIEYCLNNTPILNKYREYCVSEIE